MIHKTFENIFLIEGELGTQIDGLTNFKCDQFRLC